MSQLYAFFTPEEIACRCAQCELGEADMAPRFMRRLVDIRRLLAIRMPMTSAIRCAMHNSAVSSTGVDGPHLTGHAADFQVSGADAMRLVAAARQHGMTGIGVKQHGPHHKRFIHLDDLSTDIGRPRPWVWSYR